MDRHGLECYSPPLATYAFSHFLIIIICIIKHEKKNVNEIIRPVCDTKRRRSGS